MATVKAWIFTPENKNIVRIDIPKQLGCKAIYKLLDCDEFERQSFTCPTTGKMFSILMDGVGLLKRQKFNEAASKCLGRINLLWGNKRGGSYAHLGGKYLVHCERDYDDLIDMPSDMTPRMFVDAFNSAIGK